MTNYRRISASAEPYTGAKEKLIREYRERHSIAVRINKVIDAHYDKLEKCGGGIELLSFDQIAQEANLLFRHVDEIMRYSTGHNYEIRLEVPSDSD